MILHPSIIALLLSSALISLLLVYSSFYGVLILNRWDITSGSDLQLSLERRTYLISTILMYVFAFQLISFFLYIYTADNLHSLFVGAMCAAGTLNVNAYGYPTLVLKIVDFIFSGLWLVLNYADNRAYDYPLIRKKYLLLVIITPLILGETIMQAAYFHGLKADVITSCCGSLFSNDGLNISSEIASLPAFPAMISFYLSMALTFVSGIYFYLKGRGVYVFSLMTVLTFIVSVISLISFISLYFYELPTHHCPFCILQKEYGYAGYPLYMALLTGVVAGMGAGILSPFANIVSLREIIPSTRKRLAVISLVFYFLFALIVTYRMIFADFKLDGY